jgi:lipopolysaccharide transport system permease protein
MPVRSASQPSEPARWVIAADTREGLFARAREVWQYRRILWFFSLKSVQSLYAKTYLGVWWVLLRTLVPLAVGSFVFGTVMQVPSMGVPYFLFFLTGQIPWNFFDGPLIRASRGLDVNRQLLTKLYVPRIILPVGQMAAGLVEPMILVLVLVVSVMFYRSTDGVWYVYADARMLAALASVLVVLAFAFAVSLWTSVWQARARDARYVLRYIVSFWLFFTPVIYPLSLVPADIRWLMYLNPLTEPVETFRWALLHGPEHSWGWFGYSVGVTVATFCAGAWYFVRSESATMDKL